MFWWNVALSHNLKVLRESLCYRIMTCLIDCHSWIVIFTVNALLNAPSCIIDESNTYFDLIIQYSNINYVAFGPQLWAPTMLWTILQLQILLINHSDIIENWIIQNGRQDGRHKKSYIIPRHIPSQLTENVTGTLAFGCKRVWSNLILLKRYCNVSRWL